MLISTSVDTILGHNEEGKGSLKHIEGLDNVIYTPLLALLLLDKMGQQLAIARRVKEAASHLKIMCQLLRVYQITIMGKGKVTRIVIKREGLHVVGTSATRCRVAHMAYSYAAPEAREFLLIKDLRNQAFALYRIELVAIECRDTTSLLSAMLQSVQTVVGQIGCIVNTKDTKHSALLVQVIAIYI